MTKQKFIKRERIMHQYQRMALDVYAIYFFLINWHLKHCECGDFMCSGILANTYTHNVLNSCTYARLLAYTVTHSIPCCMSSKYACVHTCDYDVQKEKKICRWTAIAQPLIVYIVALFHEPLIAMHILTHINTHIWLCMCFGVYTRCLVLAHSLSLPLSRSRSFASLLFLAHITYPFKHKFMMHPLYFFYTDSICRDW